MGGAKKELQNHTKISVFKHQLHMPTGKAKLVYASDIKLQAYMYYNVSCPQK